VGEKKEWKLAVDKS